MRDSTDFETEIYTMLPSAIQVLIQKAPEHFFSRLQEIRIRQGRPLMIEVGDQDYMYDNDGWTIKPEQPYIISKDEITRTFQLICQGSVYALEEELKNGYLTLPGGHRVGLVGKAVMEGGKVKTLRNISGFNIRIARAVPGAADKVLPYLVKQNGLVYSTLIVSPPKAGKTTLLRDIVRQLSTGMPPLKGMKVGLVDERSEIACCYCGVPQKDVGIRTDVLDGCPKAQGIIMLIRSMSPQIVATDEIGRQEDILAIEESLNAGVSIMTTVHGKDIEDIMKRPAIRRLIRYGFFERFVILGFSSGVGTVESIIDSVNMRPLIIK